MQSPQTPPVASYPPLPPDATPAEARAYERALWNQCLTDATWRRTRFNPAPNTLLVEAVGGIPAGEALDVNMGEGRNALYLAQQGWRVTGIDLADQALAFAQRRARALGVAITTREHDADTYDWGINRWDLLVLCYADDAAHADRVQAALRPGGLVVFENFHAEVNQAWAGRLRKVIGFATDDVKNRYAAAGFEILRYEEPVAVADFTREAQRLVRLVARKR